MGELQISDVPNVDIGRRALVVSPPEPPAEYLMADPKNSIYIGRTDVFNVPFHWTYARLINPHIAITGITGSGKSGDRNTPVIVRRNGICSIERIGDLVDSLIAEKGMEQIDDCEGVSDPEVEVFAFDRELRGRWSRVRFAGRKRSPNEMYKITTASGREAITTGDHNMVILKDGMLSAAKSSTISIGDYIPVPRKLSVEGTTGSSVPLSKELMRLTGYFVSEGAIVNGKEIRIYNTDEIILEDVFNLLSLFGRPSYVYKHGEIVGARLRSEKLLSIFRGFGMLGDSGTKRAPSILFSAGEVFVSEYLRAYYEGDGCAEKNCVTATTKSKELANDHLYLLLRLGIIGRLKKKFKKATNTPSHGGDWYYQITISGRDQIEKFAQIGFVSGEKNRKLYKLLKRKKDTNVDTIPEIAGIIKKIYRVLKFDRTSMSYSVAGNIRKPSRDYLSALLAKIKDRISEIHLMGEEINQLRTVPQLSQLVQLASSDKTTNSQLYGSLDETWRRAKRNLVKTNLTNARKIAVTVNVQLPGDQQLKSIFLKAFDALKIGMQQYDHAVYDWCTGRRENTAYQKIEDTTRFIVKKYDDLLFDVRNLEKDIEFLELLANSDLFWDPIVSVEKVKSEHPYVYDLCVDDEVFLAGFGGMFVHNSYFIKTFLLRASLVWNANALIIDWAGEYKAWVKQVGGIVVALAKGAYLNLLDLAGMKPSDRVKQVVRSLEILTDVGQYPEQRRLIEQAIEEAYVRAGFKLAEKDQKDALGKPLRPPTLKDVQKILQEKLETGTYEFPAELENAIYKLKRFTLEGDDYFAEQSTVDLDKLLTSGLVALDLSGLPDETFRALGALTILQFIKEKMRMEGWSPEKGVKLFCMHGDEEITLANGENVRIRDIVEKNMIGTKVQSFNSDLKLEEDEIVAVQKLPAPSKMYKFRTANGDTLRVTPDHKLPILRDGRLEWIEAERIDENDFIICPRRIMTSGEIPRCRDLLDGNLSVNRKTGEVRSGDGIRRIRLPEYLNEEICYLHGLVASDGYIGRCSIRFASIDDSLRNTFKELMERNFGIKVTMSKNEAIVSNVVLVSLFKGIRRTLLKLPEELIVSWLKGYSDGDGSISLKHKGKYVSPYITLCPANLDEANLAKDMLLRVGIASCINIAKSRRTKVPDGRTILAKPLPTVVISGKEDVKSYIDKIGFREESKKRNCEAVIHRLPELQSFVKRDVIPAGSLLREPRDELSVTSKGFRDTIGIAVDNREYGVYAPSRGMMGWIVDEIEDMYGNEARKSIALDKLRTLVEADVMPVRIVEKTELVPDEQFVYDITTAKNHNFFVNRISSSNCVLDEAWKISRDENSDAVMIVREGRKYQFSLIVASQTPTDINEIIFSNVGTVFMLRLKFEKYLDYLQNTLRFSDYMRQRILGFGVGQSAVSMSYEATVPFSETFILRKIDGEEPIIDYFLDIHSILTEAQKRDETMPKSFSRERTAFKKRLREMGLSDERVEEVATMIEKKARHIDAVDMVIELERRGVARKAITSFFRELGIDDSTIINIFTRADQKRTGLTDREISQVVLE